MPNTDVYLTMTDAYKYSYGSLTLILSDDDSNRIQLSLKLSELQPGEYSKPTDFTIDTKKGICDSNRRWQL